MNRHHETGPGGHLKHCINKIYCYLGFISALSSDQTYSQNNFDSAILPPNLWLKICKSSSLCFICALAPSFSQNNFNSAILAQSEHQMSGYK